MDKSVKTSHTKRLFNKRARNFDLRGGACYKFDPRARPGTFFSDLFESFTAPGIQNKADPLAEKMVAGANVSASFTFNPNKAAEYDPTAALSPPAGAFVTPRDPLAGARTVSASNGSEQTGSAGPPTRSTTCPSPRAARSGWRRAPASSCSAR